jgi:diguanylate cyclase (GGDEF)-like protein
VAPGPPGRHPRDRDGARDLDHFKRLNDAHGHAAGDAVLRAVATSLSVTVRPPDVLARTGGEELVVLGLVADADEAAHLAERLRTAVAGSRTDDGHSITASIGIAVTRPVDGEDATDSLWRLIDRADAAMYEAKQQGRDRVASMWVPRARAPHPRRRRPSRLRRRPATWPERAPSRSTGGRTGSLLR